MLTWLAYKMLLIEDEALQLCSSLAGRARLFVGSDLSSELAIVLPTEDTTDLNSDECRQSREYASLSRRKLWIAARSALSRIGCSSVDRSLGLTFPHRELSVAHTKTCAVAVKFRGAIGVGVDIECEREISTRLSARIQVNSELQAIPGCDPLLLWTVKEACFKSNLCNAGTHLRNYALQQVNVIGWRHCYGFASAGDFRCLFEAAELSGGYRLAAALSVTESSLPE